MISTWSETRNVFRLDFLGKRERDAYSSFARDGRDNVGRDRTRGEEESTFAVLAMYRLSKSYRVQLIALVFLASRAENPSETSRSGAETTVRRPPHRQAAKGRGGTTGCGSDN